MAQNKRGDLIALARGLGEHSSRLTLWSEGSCAVRTGADKFLVSTRGAKLSRLTDAEVVEVSVQKLLDLIATETPTEEAVTEAFTGDGGQLASLDAALYAYFFSLEGS